MIIAQIKDMEPRFLVWFWNRHCAMFGRAPVDRFRSRAIAMRRTSDLVSLMRERLVQYVVMPDGWMPHPIAFEREYTVTHHPMDRTAILNAVHAAMTTAREPHLEIQRGLQSNVQRLPGAPMKSEPAPQQKATLHPMVTDIGVVSVMLDDRELGIYESTYEAFKKLNLPNTQHIRFRARLKQICAIGGGAGTAIFEHDDKLYKFIVKKDVK